MVQARPKKRRIPSDDMHVSSSSQVMSKLRQWSRQDLEREGLSVSGLFAQPSGEIYGEKVLEVTSTLGGYVSFSSYDMHVSSSSYDMHISFSSYDMHISSSSYDMHVSSSSQFKYAAWRRLSLPQNGRG